MTQNPTPSVPSDRRPAAPSWSLGLATALVGALAWGAACDDKSPVASDHTPPDATLVSPLPDSAVSGVSFLVRVDASDDEGVDRVEFRVDDAEAIVDEDVPYSLRIVTLGRTEGTSVRIRAEAFDLSGNSSLAETNVTLREREIIRLTTAAGRDENPTWSPDGERIAFQSDRDGGQYDLWVMDANGANAAALTTDLNDDRNPAWSPDGLWIAFDSDRSGNFDIWRIAADATTDSPTAVTTGNNDDIEPAWSLEGLDLRFASKRGTGTYYNLWHQPVSGTDADAQAVTSFDAHDRAPATGPTTGLIAFSSTLNFSEPHIYTKTVGEAEVETLTGDAGFTETDPSWLPGAEIVAYTRSSGASANVWIQAVGGANPLQVTFGAGTIGDGGAAWSPDGSRIAFHSDRGGDLDIWVLQ